MEESISVWEGEGGFATGIGPVAMTGTVNQIEWAERIRAQVECEFDRVRKALETAASRQSAKDRADTQRLIAILEEKRAAVMARREAGYFIHDWQELRSNVRDLIRADPRYKVIRSEKAFVQL